jgi:cysteine-rich repeat protein
MCRTLALLISAAALLGCSESFVVVTVEDPDGLATQADALLVGEPGEQERYALTAGLPETYVVKGAPERVFDHWVEAVGGDTVLARGYAQLRLPASDAVNATVTLSTPCDDDAVCDDGVFGNGEERCEDRVCVAGEGCPASPVDCADVVPDEEARLCRTIPDHDRCEPVDVDGVEVATFCDVIFGCIPGAACPLEDEGELCERTEPCAPDLRCLTGRCVPTGSLDLDDDNPCTEDLCDPTSGPIHRPDPIAQGNSCPIDDTSVGICVAGACAASRCGDGFVDLNQGEVCDDGDANDDATPDACREDCTRSRCGDGVTDLGEDCDDGNNVEDDACLTTCEANTCGDGFLNAAAEACDDGNADPRDACLPDCTPNVCGDGLLNLGVEACDDGNTESGDGCAADCDFSVWELDLGGPIAGAPVEWELEVVDPGADAGPADAGPPSTTTVRFVAAVTTAGALVAVDQDTGQVAWTYDAGAAVRADPAAGRHGIYLVTEGGVVHAVALETGDGLWTATLDEPTAGSNIAVSTGNALDHVYAVDGFAMLYNFNSNDGSPLAFGVRPPAAQLYSGSVEARSVDASAACVACGITLSNRLNAVGTSDFGISGMAITAGDAVFVWNFRDQCAPVKLDLPGTATGRVAFVGTLGISEGARVGFVTTTAGALVRVSLDETGVVCPQGTSVATLHTGAAIRAAPVITRPGNVSEVWYGDDDGVIHHDLAGIDLPFPFATDAAIVASLTVDGGQTLYIGDADGTLYAVDSVTARERWRLDLGGPLAGSPLVSRGFVYAATADGALLALERGGNAAPDLWWAREGGNNAGNSMPGSCSAGEGARAALLLLLAGLFLWRRPRRRATTRSPR